MFKKLLSLILACLSLGGCSLISFTEADHSIHGGGLIPSATEFSMDDLMLASMMIPHHEQAIQMAEWAKTRASSPELKKLAEQILAEQAPEIELMGSWLKQAKQTLGDHAGHMSMQGMLTDKELAELKTLTGTAFDKKFLEAMIKHHEGAVVMAKDFLSSSNEDVVALLENIVKTQNQEIEKMKELLKLAN